MDYIEESGAKMPAGYHKINVDAATTKVAKGGAIAAICRSETGLFMGASALTVQEDLSLAALEALACREALALAQDMHISHICVASDCLDVVNNLTMPYSGEYSMILTEVKRTASIFSDILFCHEKRGSNGEPHRLARSSVNLDFGGRLWLLNPPRGALYSEEPYYR
jgi:ribonuclease HI